MYWFKKQKIYILGIVHSAQNDVLLQNKLNLLKKRGFDNAFLEREKKNSLSVRKFLIQEIEAYKPDIIFEECGPWKNEPGDILKSIIKNTKTIPEIFSSIPHFFVDARNTGKEKPSQEKREEEIVCIIEEIVKTRKIKKPILVIGASHLDSIQKKFEKARFSVKSKNLKSLFPFGI